MEIEWLDDDEFCAVEIAMKTCIVPRLQVKHEHSSDRNLKQPFPLVRELFDTTASIDQEQQYFTSIQNFEHKSSLEGTSHVSESCKGEVMEGEESVRKKHRTTSVETPGSFPKLPRLTQDGRLSLALCSNQLLKGFPTPPEVLLPLGQRQPFRAPAGPKEVEGACEVESHNSVCPSLTVVNASQDQVDWLTNREGGAGMRARQLPTWAVSSSQGMPSGSSARSAESARCRLPQFRFNGAVRYSVTEAEVEAAAQTLQREMQVDSEARRGEVEDSCQGSSHTLGFDIEWRVSFQAGATPRKVALMQLCGNASSCHLLHLAHSGVTPAVRMLLEDPAIAKVGVGAHGDAAKLHRDFGVQVASIQDLGDLANQKLRIPSGSRKWGLAALVEKLLCKQMSKPQSVRTGDWEARPLTARQLSYAATDAFASLRIFQALQELPDLPQLPQAVANPFHVPRASCQSLEKEWIPAACQVEPLPPSKVEAYHMHYQGGLTVDQIAIAKHLKRTSVESYLADAIEAGFGYAWHRLGVAIWQQEAAEVAVRAHLAELDNCQLAIPASNGKEGAQCLEANCWGEGNHNQHMSSSDCTPDAPTSGQTPAVPSEWATEDDKNGLPQEYRPRRDSISASWHRAPPMVRCLRPVGCADFSDTVLPAGRGFSGGSLPVNLLEPPPTADQSPRQLGPSSLTLPPLEPPCNRIRVSVTHFDESGTPSDLHISSRHSVGASCPSHGAHQSSHQIPESLKAPSADLSFEDEGAGPGCSDGLEAGALGMRSYATIGCHSMQGTGAEPNKADGGVDAKAAPARKSGLHLKAVMERLPPDVGLSYSQLRLVVGHMQRTGRL